MTTAACPRTLEVQLMVDHPQLQSGQLAQILALPADVQWDVGQTYRPTPTSSEQIYRFSRWSIRATANSLDQLADTIQELAHRIRGIEGNFRKLPSDSTVSLTLFVTETDTVIGMGIDAPAISLLARINAGLEVSLVVTHRA